MPQFRLREVCLGFGPQIILDHIELDIHKGQHIGLLGRNGTGKSTFLKLLNGQQQPDSGELWQRPGVKVSCLSQELPQADETQVYDVVASGLAEMGQWLKEFHHLAMNAHEPENLEKMAVVQHKIDENNGWDFQQKIDTVISNLNLPQDLLMKELSGGWRRRVALGQALVSDPDVLLLDEPTNHLDIPTIQWLEKQLQSFNGTLIVITHDRAFLQNVADHIIELDRGHLTEWKGTYQGFLKHRQQQLEAEENANQLFDKKLAQEEVWIRQGVKARRTRNEGRVRALEKMRNERSERREVQGRANFGIEEASRSGKLVAEVEGVTHGYGDKTLIKNFTTRIIRGDRIGFVGANGLGKTTLLKILLGEITADKGKVKQGTKLEIAYFDQLRNKLDENKSVIDNVAAGHEFITINGNSRHVISYLKDFMFLPDRMKQPVKSLSGGEQNRLILAKLFSKPANVLVLDEPTNDLDMETLELLEELVDGFEGTILLVSHDRAFLDNVVTSCIVFEGDGVVSDNVGGYSDWLARGKRLAQESQKVDKPVSTPKKEKPKSQKLGYKEQQELAQLPALIETAELRQKELTEQISDPGFYQQDAKTIETANKEMAETQAKLTEYYARWEVLDG